MIANVLDLRARPYRWKNVVAVAQSASKDNVAEDSDQVTQDVGIEIDYAEREGISVREAVLWADSLAGMVTLYLYDADTENSPNEQAL